MQQATENYSYRDKTIRKTIAIEKMTAKEADSIIEEYKDLIDNKDYKPFFYKKLYSLGRFKFIEKAEQARKYGKQKGRYFVRLLA